ncbi:hypothetical protein H3C66_04140 [Patescibacteria group bacterium]|nr:hypothetical protein [Patescibacteria group bacterium]
MVKPSSTQRIGSVTPLIVILLFVLLALSGLGYMYWTRLQTNSLPEIVITPVEETLVQTTPSAGTAASPTAAETNEVGFIQGSLSFPSEVLPPQKICAVNTTSQLETCVEQRQGSSYKIEVPAGTYHVYAVTLDNPNTRAYYSEFVTCGLLASCPSHEPIEVVVVEGQATREVDPGDWYN